MTVLDNTVNNKPALQRLIEMAVRDGCCLLLREQDSDGLGDDVYYGGGDGFGDGGGGKTVAGVFLNPLKDIANSLFAGMEKLSAVTSATVARTVLNVVAAALPWSTGIKQVDQWFKQQGWPDKQLNKIDQRYAETFKRNHEALQNTDLLGTAFMLAPELVIAKELVKRTPPALMQVAALDVLNATTGGYVYQFITDWLQTNAATIKGIETAAQGVASVLREQTATTQPVKVPADKFHELMMALNKDKVFRHKLSSASLKLSKPLFNSVINKVKAVMSATTPEQLQPFLKGLPVEQIKSPEAIKAVKTVYKSKVLKWLLEMIKVYPHLAPVVQRSMQQLSEL